MSKDTAFSYSIDLVRTLAIVCVFLLHASNDYTVQQMSWFEIIRWNTVTVYESLGRLGVPLFLMLTGFLLLQPSKFSESIGEFFKKRWARIGLPFVFWGLVYFAYDFLVLHNINGQTISSNSIIKGILTGPYYQFWYLYLLVGLYLLTPILRVLMARADRSLIKYLLVLWLIGGFILPLIYLIEPYQLDNSVIAFTGYAGYFILGAFLVTVQIRRPLLVFVAGLGIALTAIGTYVLAAVVGGKEMFWFQQYFSPTLILASAGVFMLLMTGQKPDEVKSGSRVAPTVQTFSSLLISESSGNEALQTQGLSGGRQLLAVISANTLGLFLLHPILFDVFQKGYFGLAINGNTLNSVVSVPLNTVLVLFISLGILLAAKKIPGIKKLVG